MNERAKIRYRAVDPDNRLVARARIGGKSEIIRSSGGSAGPQDGARSSLRGQSCLQPADALEDLVPRPEY